MDRTGEYIVRLSKDGVFFGDRSMTCGAETFRSAVAQWKRKGYTVQILRQPKVN